MTHTKKGQKKTKKKQRKKMRKIEKKEKKRGEKGYHNDCWNQGLNGLVTQHCKCVK